MSRPRDGYTPTVHSTTWRAEGRPLPGVLITIPASRARLFVSADNIRLLADKLHDAADDLEGTTR